MNLVEHPGPIRATRRDLVRCSGQEIEVLLKADIPLSKAVERALTPLGIDGAWLELINAPVSQLSYVGPDLDQTKERAAWFSTTQRFEEGIIERIGMMIGQHNGASFLHGHGLWQTGESSQMFGHIISDETRLSEPATAKGVAIFGAMFDRRPDRETKFELFQAVETNAIMGEFAALRLMPNQDFTTAINESCEFLGWESAQVYGLGSLNGITFTDGACTTPQPTEFLITDAEAGNSADAPEIISIGIKGTPIQTGRLEERKNAVLITAELILRRNQT